MGRGVWGMGRAAWYACFFVQGRVFVRARFSSEQVQKFRHPKKIAERFFGVRTRRGVWRAEFYFISLTLKGKVLYRKSTLARR